MSASADGSEHSALLTRISAAADIGIPLGQLTLRRPAEQDAAAFVAACNDPDIARWTTLPIPYTPVHAHAFIARRTPAGLATGTEVAFTVADADDRALGVVGLHNIDASARAAVGFWLAPAARGRGVAAAAVRGLADWAFRSVGLRELLWHAVVGNVDSLRAAAAAGFTMEGTLHAALGHRDQIVDAWSGSLQPGADTAAARAVRRGCLVEIAAGAWQLQPVGTADALLAERLLPVSACVPAGVWSVRLATTAATEAVAALLVRGDRCWVVAAPTSALHEGAAQTGAAAVSRYARGALGLLPA